MSDQTIENLLEAEAASFLRVKPQTLANWRVRGEGPAFSKIGGRGLYRLDVLRDFVRAKERTATAGPRAA